MHNYSRTNQVKTQRISKVFFLALLALGLSSCSSLVQPSLFEIQNVPSSTGELSKANVRDDGAGVILYGRLLYGSHPGHVDASVTAPDGSITCMSTGFTRGPHGSFWRGSGLHARHRNQQFEFKFDPLPEAGSLMRVWHHQGEIHQSCARQIGDV